MKYLAVTLTVLLLLTSCTGNTTPNMANTTPLNLDAYDDHFIYPADPVYQFAVDENGIAYAAGISYIKSNKGFTPITAYDLEGNKLAEYTVEAGGVVDVMCAANGMLYFVSGANVDNKAGKALYSYDLKAKKSKFITFLDIINHGGGAKKVAYLDGSIYILDINPEYADREYELWQEDYERESRLYSYDGTILAAYDLKKDTLEVVFDGELHNFAITPSGTVMILAHDSIGGFYFAEIDPKTMSVGDRIYRRLHMPTSFAADGNGVMLVTAAGDGFIQPGNLYYLSLNANSGTSEMVQNVKVFGRNDDIAYYNGFTYYLRSSNLELKLERVKNSIYVKDNTAVKVISVYTGDVPQEGYIIDFNDIGYDKFALTVLSRDTAYDTCYVSSRSDFATSIKDKGSFYPLNDVPGVQEFMDACFPYIKDAATDMDGNIWMLPIDINVEAIAYHDENCRKAGIEFADTTMFDIIDIIMQTRNYDTMGSNYYFSGYSLFEKNILKYFRSNISLETPEFRRIASALKTFLAEKTTWGDSLSIMNPDVLVREVEPLNPEFLFANSTVVSSLQYITRDDLHVAPLTGTDGTPNSADCVFLCVNPNSSNLDTTLDYISAVCEYLLTLNDSFMLKDPSTYTDSDYARRLYALYENSVIDFNISDEVFANDFDRYLQGEIDLDTMITEADRKLAMYRGE